MPRRVLALGLAIEAIFLAAVLGPFSLLAHGAELTDLGKLTNYQLSAAILVSASLVALFALYAAALLVVSSVGARAMNRDLSARPTAGGLTRRRGERTTRRAGRGTGTGRAAVAVAEPEDAPGERDPRFPRGADRRYPQLLSIALGLTALFSATMVFLYPVTAIDVFNYAVEGHIAVYHGVNPMVTPPSSAANDTFVSYAGSWIDSTSPYGPVWILLTQVDALLAGSNVVLAILLLKILAAIAVVATAGCLAAGFRHRGPLASALAAMIFGWNPLVQLEMVGHGHNDAVMSFFLVAALVMVARNQTILGALGVGVSVLIKFLTLGTIPLFLVAEILTSTRSAGARWARVAMSAAVIVALAIVAYAPFWTGLATIERAQAV